MSYKHACVVDADGLYVSLVLVLTEPTQDGTEQAAIQHYTLQEGDVLIDAAPPDYRAYTGAVGLVTPCWDGATWIEAATTEEVAAWEAAHPAPEAPLPSIGAINAMAIAELSMAQAQQSTESAMAITELSILIGGIGNVQ
ncbi:MAG: hypothetical protein ACK5L0_03285 [Candidatus Fimivivens sp.]